jgi:hypothetical protein
MNCDEMYQAAEDYIAEDHVDGEDMPEEENTVFFKDDMRNAFVAGETYEKDDWMLNNGDIEENGELDFGEWMEQTYNVKIS